MAVEVTVVVENTAGGAGVLGEHGLAYWIETRSTRILFDTGAGALLSANARALDISPATADAIALSHGHYDHTGGLALALEIGRRPAVYLHPAALEAKYSIRDGRARRVGLPHLTAATIRAAAGEVVWTDRPTEIADGVFVTGEIPRANDFEDVGGPFYLDKRGGRADPLLDDQAAFFDTPDGTVVLLGCAHAGVVNTVAYVRTLTGGRPVAALIGGMHLLEASPVRIARTLDALRRWSIPLLCPLHCTGMPARVELAQAFAPAIVHARAGSRWTFASAAGGR